MENLMRDVSLNGIRWDVEMAIWPAVRERCEMIGPWIDREERGETLLGGLADRCVVEDAPALMTSLKRFAHYAAEAVREDLAVAIRGRYERAADRELKHFAQLPLRVRTGLLDTGVDY